MKLVLSLHDRITAAGLMPRQANLNDQVLAMDIGRKLELTKEENERINYRKVEKEGPNGPMVWFEHDVELAKAATKEIGFTNSELSFLKGRVESMDKKAELTQRVLSVALKIRDAKSETEKVTEPQTTDAPEGEAPTK